MVSDFLPDFVIGVRLLQSLLQPIRFQSTRISDLCPPRKVSAEDSPNADSEAYALTNSRSALGSYSTM
jgi:hypothetical protein